MRNQTIDPTSRDYRDIMQLIFIYFSPKELATVAKVCRFWNEQAQIRSIRSTQNPETFFPWLVENLAPSFKKINLFLSKKELVQFLLNDSLSLACKIAALDNLTTEIPPDIAIPLSPADKNRFFGWEYFLDSLRMDSRRNNIVHSALKKYINSLLPQLIQVYRALNNSMREDIQEKFAREVSNPNMKFSHELEVLLKPCAQQFISLKQSFYSLQKIPTGFVNQAALANGRKTLHWELPGFLVGIVAMLYMSYKVANSTGVSRAPALLLLLVCLLVLRKISAYANKFNAGREQAQGLLRQSEPEDENDNGPLIGPRQ
jgi:hypothetical protein